MRLKIKLFGKRFFKENENYSKKVDYADYYKVTHLCNNCNTSNVFYVKKGIQINDIAIYIPCDNCGCRLEKKEK